MVQKYAEWLQTTQELRFSSIANYASCSQRSNHTHAHAHAHAHPALLGSVTVCSRSGVRLHRCSQINGLVSVTTYVYNLDPPPPEETLLMDPTPLTQVWWLPHKRTRMAFPGAHMSKTPRATTTNAHS